MIRAGWTSLSDDAECWAGTHLCCRKVKLTRENIWETISQSYTGLSVPITLFSSVASIFLYLPFLHYLPFFKQSDLLPLPLGFKLQLELHSLSHDHE